MDYMEQGPSEGNPEKSRKPDKGNEENPFPDDFKPERPDSPDKEPKDTRQKRYSPKDVEEFTLNAVSNLRKGNNDEALAFALKAREAAKQNFTIRDFPHSDLANLLGAIYFRQGNGEESIKWFNTAIKEKESAGFVPFSADILGIYEQIIIVSYSHGLYDDTENALRSVIDRIAHTQAGTPTAMFCHHVELVQLLCFQNRMPEAYQEMVTAFSHANRVAPNEQTELADRMSEFCWQCDLNCVTSEEGGAEL